MKQIHIIIRLVVGILFIISGFVKLVDPMGFSYKLEEYFSEEVFNIPFLANISYLLAIVVVWIEMILGIFLILAVKKKWTLGTSLILMIFFTGLTLFSAISGKVQDCGCFGDALKLEPWESFYKDVFLLVAILILIVTHKWYQKYLHNIFNYTLVVIMLIVCGYFPIYAARHLPWIDFRAYAVGKNIPQQMEIPEGAPAPVINTIWKYKVDGEVKEYTNEDKPWEIPNAEYVDRADEIIDPGYLPPITDFALSLPDGSDITNEVLQSDGVVLIFSKDILQLETTDFEYLKKLELNLAERGHKLYIVTSSLEADIKKVNHNKVSYVSADLIVIKTVVRANPGFLSLKNGIVKQKWSSLDRPSLSEILKSFD